MLTRRPERPPACAPHRASLADKIDKTADVSKDDLRTVFPAAALPEPFRAVLYTEEYLREQAGGDKGEHGEAEGRGGERESGGEPHVGAQAAAASAAEGSAEGAAPMHDGPEAAAAAASNGSSSSDSEGSPEPAEGGGVGL